MSTSTTDGEYNARKIHQSLGGTTAFFRGYTIGELMLFLTVAFVTVVAATFVPARLTIPVLGFGIMLTILLLLLHRVKPGYLWLTEWLAARFGWAIKNKEYTHGGEDTSEVRYMTRLERVYPHATERTDGALVGAVKVEPANMALEDDDAWAKAVNSLSEFVNSTVDFPVQIYITTREIDADDVTRVHRDRLGDDDVRSRPVLKRLLEKYVAANTNENGEVDSETTAIREYYLVTSVTDADVEQVDETSDSVLAYLTDTPVLGRCLGRFQSEELTESDRDQLKEDRLESRLARLRRGGSSLYRCSVDPIDAYDLARITKEYWSCRPEEYADITDAPGTFPVVSHGIADGVPSTPDPDAVLGAMDGVPGSSPAARLKEESDNDEGESIGEDFGDSEEADEDEDSTGPSLSNGERLPATSTLHQSVIVPSTVDWETTYAVIDDEAYVRTFWIEQFSEEPSDGLFERLLLETDLQTDVSIHLDPFDSQSAQDMMADWILDLKINQHDSNTLKSEDLQDDIDQAKLQC